MLLQLNLAKQSWVYVLLLHGIQVLSQSSLTVPACDVRVQHLRLVPSWIRAMETESFDGCQLSEIEFFAPNGSRPLDLQSLPRPEVELQAVFDGSYETQVFDMRCSPAMLSLESPAGICGYRLITASSDDARDPLGFEVHGSNDAVNWFILDSQLNYSRSLTPIERSAPTQLFAFSSGAPTDLFTLSNMTHEAAYVQHVIFVPIAPRGWSENGFERTSTYYIAELQLLVDGQILDLSDATVSHGGHVQLGYLAPTTTSRSTTSFTSSTTSSSTSFILTLTSSSTQTLTFTPSSTSSSTGSSTTSSSTARTSTTSVSTTNTSITSTSITSTSITSTSITSTSITSTSITSTSITSTSNTNTTASTTSSSATSTSSSTSTGTTSSSSTNHSTSTTVTETSTYTSTTGTNTSTTPSGLTTTTTRTTTSLTSRTWTSTTLTSSTSTTSSSTSTTSLTNTSTSTTSSTSSATSTSTSSLTNTTTSFTGTSSSSSISSMTNTTSTSLTTSTSDTLTSSTSSSTTSGTSTSASSTSTSSTSTSTTSSTTTLSLDPIRIDLSEPVMLEAFRFITGSISMAEDPVQFSLWGSEDNVSWMHLYDQSDYAAGVPSSRESPTAWYLVSTTTTTGPSFAEALQNALDALNAKKLSYLSLLDGLENITGGGLLAQKIDIDPDGTITAAFVMAPPQDDSAVVLGFGDVQVEVPAATLEAFGGPAVAVMGLLAPGGALFDILNSSELQSDVVSLDIFVNGSAIGDLASPIHFTIPAELAGPADPTCAYLDEERQEWSTVGVSLINVTNTSLLCSTTHLSLFGGIMRSIEQALLCSNAAAIFSIEGLRSLTSRLWIFEWAAILNWIMLLVGAGLLGCARVADLRNQDRMDLTRTIASLKANAKHYAQTHDQHAHHGLGHMLEELYDVLDTGPARMIYSQMLRVQTGFGLKALAKIYQKSGHTALHSRAEAFLLDFSTWSCWRKLCFWYSMQCRWISFQHLNARSSSMVRCSVLLGKIYSGWAMSAVFYGSSAISPGEEDGCLPVEGFLDALVRSLVVQIISAFFGALPFVVLVFLFYQLKGVRLSIRTGIFWSCLAIYFLLCIMVVCIFIASTSSSDGTKWFMTSTLGILLSLIRPLVLIFLMWMVVTTAVWIDARRKRFPSSHPQAAYHILPWPSLDSIIAYEVKFASLEVIERKRSSTRKLFIVTIEVGGRPKSRVIFQQKDDAFRVTEESFKATEGHLMLISVYQNKMDKAHLRGQTEIGVNELLVNGLSSKLPLHLDGRSVPMQVSVHVPPPLRPASQVVSSLEDVLVDEVEAGIEEDGLAEAAESPETRVEIAQIDEEILAQTPGSPESFAQEAPVEVLPVSARVSSSTSLPHDRSDESIPAEAAAFRVRGDLLLGSKTWSQSVRQAAQVRAPPTELRRIEEVEELEAEAPASSPRIKPSSLQGSPVPPVPELPPMPAPAPVPTPRITPRDPDTPRRHELLEKVKDSNLRELCSIAEQRQVLAAPARSKGT